METEDVSEHFDCLKAERRSGNTLILRRLDHFAISLDGRARRFELEYRWHPSPTSPINSVQGNEFTFQGYRDIRGWKTKSLFDLFRLFP